ncbi:unnamed protein product [Tenebrio molitor]|nr:unnamed protein product [Tenebrio molitor]
MKPLFVFLLLIVVVSVVRGATKGSVCISKCDEEEQKCSDDSYCVIITTNKDSNKQRVKLCVPKKLLQRVQNNWPALLHVGRRSL